MQAEKIKTYDDYLQEARSVTKEQLVEMCADWRMPNRGEPLDYLRWANPPEDDIRYFSGM